MITVSLDDHAWVLDAVCASTDPAIWHDPEMQLDCIRICDGCPVRRECLDAALAEETDDGMCWGVRGGQTPATRLATIAGIPTPPWADDPVNAALDSEASGMRRETIRQATGLAREALARLLRQQP